MTHKEIACIIIMITATIIAILYIKMILIGRDVELEKWERIKKDWQKIDEFQNSTQKRMKIINTPFDIPKLKAK